MFFILSKTLYYLLMPVTWLLLITGYALYTRRPQLRKRLIAVSLGMLLILSNPFLINELFLWWEEPPVPFAQVQSGYEVAIVLTGFTNDNKSPKDRLYFNRSADRLLHAFRLYKEGKVKKILICGAEFSPPGDLRPENRSSKDLLLMSGVPDSVVIIENRSRNTRENALFAAEILGKQFPGKKYLLVTSAFHIRRARGCFEQAGIPVDVFSTDFNSRDRTLHPLNMILPSEEAIGKWGILTHEIQGYLVYDVMGYL